MTELSSEPIVTLPHEREILGIVQLAVDMQEQKQQLALVITDHQQHVQWIIQKLHDATAWDTNNVKLFRDGIETKFGGKIIVRSAGYPGSMMGLRPDRIILMGQLGELFYHLKSMGCEVEVIA